LNLTKLVASARDDMIEKPERILTLPEKGRDARAAELRTDLLKNEDVIRVRNQPDPEAGILEILESLGLNAKTSLMNMRLKFVKGYQIVRYRKRHLRSADMRQSRLQDAAGSPDPPCKHISK